MRWPPAGRLSSSTAARSTRRRTVEIDPSPDGLRAALARSLDAREPHLGEFLGLALMVDHDENLTPADRWVRGELLPELADDAIAVLAGRDAPDAA
jgi:hypothetical protein